MTDKIQALSTTGGGGNSLINIVKSINGDVYSVNYELDHLPYVGENILLNTNSLIDNNWYWFGPTLLNINMGEGTYPDQFFTISFDCDRMNGLPQVVLAGNYGEGSTIRFSQVVHLGKNVCTYIRKFGETYPISCLAFIGDPSQGASIKNLKMEFGNKATPYILNSRDVAKVMDYSILTEQIVPNEFWPHHETGQPKQVYLKTYKGTIPTTVTIDTQINVNLENNIRQAFLINALIINNTNYKFIPSDGIPYIIVDNNNRLVMVVCHQFIAEFFGRPYQITIKYTKI